jgi:hypothetical protein
MKLSDQYPSDTRVQSPELVGDLSRAYWNDIIYNERRIDQSKSQNR